MSTSSRVLRAGYFEKGTQQGTQQGSQEGIDERAHESGASDVFFQINALRNDRLANLSGRDSGSKEAFFLNKGTKK